MTGKTNFSKAQLIKIQDFLSTVLETNEDTEYNPSEEELVDSIIQLTAEQEKTSITEDFSVPYVHPMITIQKWSTELKQMTDALLNMD